MVRQVRNGNRTGRPSRQRTAWVVVWALPLALWVLGTGPAPAVAGDDAEARPPAGQQLVVQPGEIQPVGGLGRGRSDAARPSDRLELLNQVEQELSDHVEQLERGLEMLRAEIRRLETQGSQEAGQDRARQGRAQQRSAQQGNRLQSNRRQANRQPGPGQQRQGQQRQGAGREQVDQQELLRRIEGIESQLRELKEFHRRQEARQRGQQGGQQDGQRPGQQFGQHPGQRPGQQFGGHPGQQRGQRDRQGGGRGGELESVLRQIADELRELNRRLDDRGRGGYPSGYRPCTKVDLKVDRDGQVCVDGQPYERRDLPGYLQQIGACEVNITHHPSLSSDALNRLLRCVQSVPLRDVTLTADETAPRVRVAVEWDGRLDVGGQGHSIQSLGRHLEQKGAYHLTIVSHPKVSTGYIERLIAQAQAAGVVEFELEG